MVPACQSSRAVSRAQPSPTPQEVCLLPTVVLTHWCIYCSVEIVRSRRLVVINGKTAVCADANITQFYIDAEFVEAEGVFKWSSTNETLSYTNWAPNEPNNLTGNEQCVQMFGNVDGSWNDVECSNRYAIVCQIPGAYLRQHPIVSAKVAESCFDVGRIVI